LLPTSLRLIHSFLLSIIAYTSLSFYSHITSNLVFTLSLISIINYRLVQTSLNPCLPFFIVISCVYGAYVYPVRLLTTIHRYENYITLGLHNLYCFPTVSYIAVKFIYFCDFFFLFLLFIPYEGNLGGFFFFSSPINGQRGEVGECRRATRRSLSLILSSDWSDSLRVLVLRPRIMRRIAVVA